MMPSSPGKSSSSRKGRNTIRHADAMAGRWGTRGAGGNDAVLTREKQQQQEGKKYNKTCRRMAGRWGTRGAGGNDAVLTRKKQQQQEGLIQ